MAMIAIDVGAVPNDDGGDDLRTAGGSINSNFTELYARTGGFDSHSSAPAQSAYVDSLGNLGVGTTSPLARMHLLNLNGTLQAAIFDVNDMNGATGGQSALLVDVDIADYTPTADRVHYGLQSLIDSAATSTGQSAGARQFLYGLFTQATAAGDQYQAFGVFGEARHTSAANDMDSLYGGSFIADAEADSGTTTVTTAHGVRGRFRASGAAAAVTGACGGLFEAAVSGAGAVVTSAEAVKAVVEHTGGTLTTAYQFRGESSGTIGTSWGIYSEGAAKSQIEGAAVASSPLTVLAVDASFTADVLRVQANRAASSSFDMMTATADVDGTPNDVFRIRGDGEVTADGSFTGGGADYAELFEWAGGQVPTDRDGAPFADLRGRTVVLAGGQIRLATDRDAPAAIIGGVSAMPVVLGDASDFAWHGMWKRDAFGAPIEEPYRLIEWTETIETVEVEMRKTGRKVTSRVPRMRKASLPMLDRNGQPVFDVIEHDEEVAVERVRAKQVRHQYMADRVPPGIDPPPTAKKRATDGKGRALMRRVLNPLFDPALPYTPRRERPEWAAIGLVGKLILRADAPKADGWLLLEDLGDGLERWLVR